MNVPPGGAAGVTTLRTRLIGATGLAAIVTQMWQAGTSFALQILAAHLLGAPGLGLLALCLGAIVVGTAVTSGFVGDSLTVLDRHDPNTRAGLQAWAVIAMVASSLIVATTLWLTGVLQLTAVILLFFAALAFQAEEVLRRVLMANQRFWSLFFVDSTALIGSVAVIAVSGVTGGISITSFLLAIVVGQSLGCLAALVRIPAPERVLVNLRGADLRGVAHFGAWRGAQVGITPALLTAARTIVIAGAGLAALGALEASRIFVAPMVLAVQGFGSYLLVSYVRDSHLDLSVLVRRATRAALCLGAATVAFGALAAVAVPLVGHLVSGPDFTISPAAVVAWAVYSGAVATLQPFASLAAARRRQRAVFGMRVLDSSVALALVAVISLRELSVDLVPLALAVGPLVGGALIRRLILQPLARDQANNGSQSDQRPPASDTTSERASGRPLHSASSSASGPTKWHFQATSRSSVRGLALVVVAALGASVLAAPMASADSGAPTPPTTVTADALPTWQINGVVWSQITVGTTVYVTGSFTKARPPGVAVGGAGEVPASNIFAYDIATGQPVQSFSHVLNAQGLVLKASPDGSRVYVGGDFTTVDGVTRSHVAAFDTAANTLTSWDPNVQGQVRGLGITSDAVYVGGNFGSANGQVRTSLAAFDVGSRAIKPWAPTAEGPGGYVWTMVMAPDNSRVIVGGSFSTLSGQPAYGMGAVDAASGDVLPWAAQTRIRTAGLKGAITSLKTDGDQIYGSGYAFGAGASFEGTFAADPYTGEINWVNDCLGDSYDTFVLASVLYTVSHSHNCSVVGGFPDTSPRSRWQKAFASPTSPIGTITQKDAYGWDFRGLPYAGLLHWYPDLDFGKYTPDRQAAWSVTGTGGYIALGGEFPKVNGVAQQGLVRFALPSTAPRASKPIYSASMTPVATSSEAGRVRLSWQTTWDRDDETLTYEVYRDNGPSIGSVSSDSIWWRLPWVGFVDSAAAPGTTHTYKVRAKDKDGNVQWTVASNSVTVSDAPLAAYPSAVRSDGATHLWRLGDAGPGFVDGEGFADGTTTGVTFGVGGAVDGDTAIMSAGGSTAKLMNEGLESHPEAVTVEAWVNTTTTAGGRIAGFGDSAKGTASTASNDMVLYLTNAGKLAFGLNQATGWRSVTSSRSVNDGQWHHLTASADASGVSLFVDGRRVGRDQSPAMMKSFTGSWRLLADQTSGLPSRPTNAGLAGAIDEVAVYPTALSQARVQAHYVASGRVATWSDAPADTYGAAVQASAPESYWRLDEISGPTAADASTSGEDGTFSGGVTPAESGAVAGGLGRAITLNGANGVVYGQESWNNPTAYSAELWFRTTTTRGGRLVGFSSAQTGNSSKADRQVCMLNNGRLQFGTGTTVASRALAESTTAYNDGAWHHVVATQGPSGMVLYVDGLPAATNTATDAGAYTGWWRVGGDKCFGGQSSSYIAATVDEAAAYPTALTAAEVKAHFTAAGGVLPNETPTAAFTNSSSFLVLTVDGSDSSDADGTISSYAWEFGDGGTATGATAAHEYVTAGTYDIRLTVTDNRGGTATRTTAVTVAANQAPVASFTHDETGLRTSADGSDSSDSDGTIASYAWDFGDGATATGATAAHIYAAAGTYDVTLTVTDDQGRTGTDTKSVTVTLAPNQLPTASFTTSKDFTEVSVDGSGSSDPDGTIASYAWDFGDGATASSASATHTYAAGGTYDVTLTVTDDRGGLDTSTVTVPIVDNQPPTASFTHTETFLVTTLDASPSGDEDGEIAAYAWDFGDGTVGSGRTADHAYGAAGTYSVVLTVTDDRGRTGTTSAQVTVAANPFIAADDFGRSLAVGWGKADTGGSWTLGGPAARWSVADGAGRLSLNAGDGYTASVPGVSTSSSDISAVITTDKMPTGGGQYASVIARRVAASADYRAKVRMGSTGVVTVWVTRNEGGSETVLGSANASGLTYAAGDRVRVRVQATGTTPTTLRAKVWKDGTTEPAAWLISSSDATTALQTAGSVAFNMYLTGSTTNGPVVYGIDEMRVASQQ